MLLIKYEMISLSSYMKSREESIVGIFLIHLVLEAIKYRLHRTPSTSTTGSFSSFHFTVTCFIHLPSSIYITITTGRPVHTTTLYYWNSSSSLFCLLDGNIWSAFCLPFLIWIFLRLSFYYCKNFKLH